MKKSVAITLGVVIVGAAGWLGATWYTGKRIEESAQRRLNETNEKLAKITPLFGLRIDQLKYERGFFSTQARYGISLLKNENAPDDLPSGMIEFDARIEHGPFPRSALARGAIAPKLAFVHTEMAQTDQLKPLFELTKNVPPLSGDAVVSYGGNANSKFQVPPLQFKEGDSVLDFSGMQLAGTYERAQQAVTGHAVIDKIAVNGSQEGKPFSLSISGLSGDANSRMGKFGLSVGDSGIKVKRIEIADPNGAMKLALDDFGYGVTLSENDKSIGVKAAYDSGKVTVNDIAVGSGQMVVTLANLDGQAVKQFSDTYNQIVRQAMAGATDEGLKDEQVDSLLDTGTQLLAGNPSFAVEPLSWKTDKGESKLNFALELSNPADAKDLTPQEIAVRAIKRIDATLVVSKPMVQDLVSQYLMKTDGLEAAQAGDQAAEQVRTLAGMAEMFNIGANDGDNIVGKFHYADGMGDLNGKKIPAEVLFASLLEASGQDDGQLSLDDEGGPEEMSAAEATQSAADAAAEAAAAAAGDDARAAAGMMRNFDADTVGGILDDIGFSYSKKDGDNGPVLVLEPSYTGATDLRLEFLCEDGADSCLDLTATAVYATKKPVPLKAINGWNQQYRWARAYVDDQNRAVLQMDMNSEGGIGRESLQILLNTFFSLSEDFSATVDPVTGKR